MDILSINSEFNISLNRDYFIENISSFKLEHVLMQHNKSMLMQKAVAHEIVGRSKMNKSALVSVLLNVIVDSNSLEETFILLDEEEYTLCQMLRESESISVSINEKMPFKYRFLIDRGIINCIFHSNNSYEYFITNEVKEALTNLDWKQINNIRNIQLEILKYIKSAVNLYGVCKPQLVTDIYNSHHFEKITVDDLLHICRSHSKRMQYFYEYRGYIISVYFEHNNISELDDLLIRIKNKPYYIPSKEIFTRYEDSLYYEITPQLLKLKLFIYKELCQNEELSHLLMDEIQLICSMEEPIQNVINELVRRGITLKSYDQMQKLGKLLVDVYNHTRLWSNCGHMPIELNPSKVAKQLNSGDQEINPLKIGRNEPCYCGSGKKYKKCCGLS